MYPYPQGQSSHPLYFEVKLYCRSLQINVRKYITPLLNCLLLKMIWTHACMHINYWAVLSLGSSTCWCTQQGTAHILNTFPCTLCSSLQRSNNPTYSSMLVDSTDRLSKNFPSSTTLLVQPRKFINPGKFERNIFALQTAEGSSS